MFKKTEKCELPEEKYDVKQIDSESPIMIWDGECAFCARYVRKWEKITGNKVRYVPYQFLDINGNGRLSRFPSLSVGDCQHWIQLVMPNGFICRGAEAIFRALHVAGKMKVLLWLYEYFPGFKFISERFYRLVASRRPLFSKI